MPCSAATVEYLRGAFEINVDPSTIYFRPSYKIVGDWKQRCNEWLTLKDERQYDTEHIFKFKNIDKRDWKELGHEELDSAEPIKFSDKEKEIMNQLECVLRIKGKIQAVDVERGMWDVKNLRKELKNLGATASEEIKRPFCKTSRLLLAWAVEVEIRPIPEAMDVLSIADISEDLIRFPTAQRSENGKGLVFKAGGDNYPILLGVIAKVV
jgi:hypothetical protein